MNIFEKPLHILKRDFGNDAVTLIYGDFKEGQIVLYSNKPLPGYSMEDGIYQKRIDEKNPYCGLLYDSHAKVFPGTELWRTPSGKFEFRKVSAPRKWEVDIFGIDGSYGYAASLDIFRAVQNPEVFEYESNMPHFKYCITLPPEITIAHEGAHVLTGGYDDIMPPEFGSFALDSDDFLKEAGLENPEIRNFMQFSILGESVSMWAEERLLKEFEPKRADLLDNLDKSYSLNPNPIYKHAHRTLKEHPEELAEIIKSIKRNQVGRMPQRQPI